MKLRCYLIVSHTGSVSVRRSGPGMHQVKPGHVVLPLNVHIPDSAFVLYLQSQDVRVPEGEAFQAAVEIVQEEAKSE